MIPGESASKPQPAPRRRWRNRSRWDWLALLPAVLIGFAILATVLGFDSGMLGLARVVEEQLFVLTLIVLLPIGLLFRSGRLTLGLAGPCSSSGSACPARNGCRSRAAPLPATT